MATSTNFFTEGHPLHTVSAAWRERKTQLRAAQLQDANDYLYHVVSRDILSRRAEIHEALTAAVQGAQRASDLYIPIWAYNTTWYDEQPDLDSPAYEEAQLLLRTKGYNWSVGLTGLGVDPETITDTASWNWMWTPNSRATVHDVVTQTDFKQRLALMFGPNFWVTVNHRVAYKKVLRPLPAVVSRFEVRLHYFPSGNLRAAAVTALDTARAKYARYQPKAYAAYEKPTVWKGVPSKVERVVPTALSYESPAPSTPSSMPPLLPTRTNGRALNPGEMREVAKALFRAEGAVGSYTMPPCYCGYHHEDEDIV